MESIGFLFTLYSSDGQTYRDYIGLEGHYYTTPNRRNVRQFCQVRQIFDKIDHHTVVCGAVEETLRILRI